MPRFTLTIAALLVIATVLPVVAQTPTPTTDPPIVPSGTPAAVVIEASPLEDLTTFTPLPLRGERREAFSAFIAEALEACGTPGAAVVVVQNGEVVFLEGFGVREYGRLEPVTPDTLFGIGSSTKSVTATMAAALVDRGVVDWDTPVVELLPQFALSEAERTAEVTFADLFSAATGLPRRDLELVFESDAFTPDGLIAAIQSYPLTAPLGEQFQYSNQAIAIGGYAAAAAYGALPGDLQAGYRAAVQHTVLNPIGMTRSSFVLDEVLASGDYAAPHAADFSGTPQPVSVLVEDRFLNSVTPAGALWSTARDMGRYLQTQLARGVAPDGTRVISEENLLRTWQPGVPITGLDEAALIGDGLEAYGLGWFSGDYGGLQLISHSGGTFGFAAEVAFLPEANLGIGILSNEVVCGGLFAFAAQYRLFELVFEQESVAADQFSALIELIATERAAAVAALTPVDDDTVAPLLGWYEHPALGRIELSLRDGELMVDAGEVRSRLMVLPSEPDVPARYVAVDAPLSGGSAWITFESGDDGELRPILTQLSGAEGEPLVYPFVPIEGDAVPATETPTS